MQPKLKTEHYYGSLLNKFIDEQCSHEMTCNNIDCILLKRSKKQIHIIESKNTHEGMPKSQRELLDILHVELGKIPNKEWDIKNFMVIGNYPYEHGATIIEVGSKRAINLSKQELIDWLEFKKELAPV